MPTNLDVDAQPEAIRWSKPPLELEVTHTSGAVFREIVLGEGEGEQLFDPHARMALAQRIGARPVTARFKLRREGRYLSALLDYIMVSQNVRALGATWTILHPFDHAACFDDKDLCAALLTASDHFPVVLDLTL